MARQVHIAGTRIYRRSVVKLNAAEKAELAWGGSVLLRRPVQWPLSEGRPDFALASVDQGGTDLWGPGPYLKVPVQLSGSDWQPIHRVFCPWGYPPDRLRLARSSVYLQIQSVDLVCIGPAAWEWRLVVVPWAQAPVRPVSAIPMSG